MNIEKLDHTKPVIFLGDHHGCWFDVLDELDERKITNSYRICVGDSGIGFEPKDRRERLLILLNNEFAHRNIHFMSIRGNHDDPLFFTGKNRVKLSNFELIEDYTVMSYDSTLIQFIGGAISIDRTHRTLNVSYWSDEGLVLDLDKTQKVDVLVTHTAPSRCFPQQFNQMVYDWAKSDTALLAELTSERTSMDSILASCNPSLHVYGHFHHSWTETVENCKHKLLNINELWEFVPSLV
jgi:Icc-related predicted phosphoesterase